MCTICSLFSLTVLYPTVIYSHGSHGQDREHLRNMLSLHFPKYVMVLSTCLAMGLNYGKLKAKRNSKGTCVVFTRLRSLFGTLYSASYSTWQPTHSGVSFDKPL